MAETIKSVAAQRLPNGCSLNIIVADNDESPSARALVEEVAQTSIVPIRYVHAPERNISVARNACLDAATAPLVAFIDDDEIAAPGWLSALLRKQIKTQAEVVLGPVRSHYPENSPRWAQMGDFHSVEPVWVEGRIVTGYTSNVLFVRAACQEHGLRFEPELGRSGGEDTVFFSAFYRAGGYIAYAKNAVVTEDVARERLSFWWLAKRSFRSGQTHGVVLMSKEKTRVRYMAVAFAKACFCVVAALGHLIIRREPHRWALRGTLHAGVVARLLGRAEIIQYGQSNSV